MANDVARDYLGHPCRFTEAKSYFSETLTTAQQNEFREIKRQIGRQLLELSDRISHSHSACRAIAGLTEAIPDAEEPHAMLEIITAYDRETTNLFWSFAGLVLAGIEKQERA